MKRFLHRLSLGLSLLTLAPLLLAMTPQQEVVLFAQQVVSTFRTTSAGIAAAPAVAIANPTTGFYSVSTTGLCFADVNGTCEFEYGITNSGFLSSPAAQMFLGGTTGANNYTILLSGAVGYVNGASGSGLRVGGAIKALAGTAGLAITGNITNGGTAPTGTTGSCSVSTFVAGAVAGQFTAPVCAAGTIILSAMPAAPHGYSCDAWDQTTPADTLVQTASSTTSVTFKATTVASDVVVFKCLGY